MYGEFHEIEELFCFSVKNVTGRRTGIEIYRQINSRRTLYAFGYERGRRSRAVLTNGHTGHVPRAPGFFFFLRGPQLAVVKFFKLIILLLPLMKPSSG